MSAENSLRYPEVETFKEDGRKPLHVLYEKYFSLVKEGWKVEKVCVQEEKQPNGDILELPIYAFISPKMRAGPEWTFWHFGVIHGEEPASAEASYNQIDVFKSLPDYGIPTVAIFMMNPSAYHRDWRYFNQYRRPNTGPNFGQSVGDCEHLVPHTFFRNIPRRFRPNNMIGDTIARWVLDVSQVYKPLLVMDHHEDEFQKNIFSRNWDSYYSYAYGDRRILNRICPQLAKILEKSGHPIQQQYETRFHEKAENGFVINSMDGSIDQLFAEDKWIDHGKLIDKCPSKAVFVLETVIHHENPQSISERAHIHEEIMGNYVYFWKVVKSVK
jgi:hypothetical protein